MTEGEKQPSKSRREIIKTATEIRKAGKAEKRWFEILSDLHQEAFKLDQEA